jgi:hypothetical protein
MGIERLEEAGKITVISDQLSDSIQEKRCLRSIGHAMISGQRQVQGRMQRLISRSAT